MPSLVISTIALSTMGNLWKKSNENPNIALKDEKPDRKCVESELMKDEKKKH